MAFKLYVLNEDDRRVLKEVIDREARRPKNSVDDGGPGHPVHTSEVYIAKVPEGGIPALEIEAAYGTGDDTYIPGEASCEIYKLDNTVDPPELIPAGFSRTVYNVTDSVLSSEFVIIVRDKFGRWVPSSGGAGGQSIRFEVIAAGPFLGEEGTAGHCNFVRARVLDVSCGGAGVEVDDEVLIWDPSGCHFNIPIEVLEGAHGTANRMVTDISGVDCVYERLDQGRCWWVVIALCCTEDVVASG